jgi:hypothetical protein
MATEKFANNASTTLNGAILDTSQSLVVTSASGFPTNPQFRLKIDNEILLVTGVSGTTYTVTRGQEGTSGVGHANGATVTHILTADTLVHATSNQTIPSGQNTLVSVEGITSAITVTLSASPTTGQRVIIKDANGLAGTYAITIVGNGNFIDGGPNYVISTPFEADTLVYNGSRWMVT